MLLSDILMTFLSFFYAIKNSSKVSHKVSNKSEGNTSKKKI